MNVTVKLFATLRDGRFDVAERTVTESCTVADLLAELLIPPEQAALCLVNRRHADQTERLSDGDVLALFPPIGGG